ncbi:MAG: hypothetical protein HOF50_02305 [Candidatus Marinimicrobia bacterium]|nr:hypothetical protein [Candidatus Neomarinimicrobiota bacterium]
MIPRLFIPLIFISLLFGVDSPDHGLRFNGGGYVRVEDSESLTLDGDFTIEFWTKVDSGYGYGHILNKHQPGNNDDGSWVIKYSEESIDTLFLVFSWAYLPNRIFCNVTDYIVGQEWFHFAVTFVNESEDLSLWLNGNRVTRKSVSPNLMDTPWPLIIGSESGYNYFKGNLAEIRISNIPRYTHTFRPQNNFLLDKNTIAYWPADQTLGKKLIDMSGLNNNGILVNVTWLNDNNFSIKLLYALFILIIIGSISFLLIKHKKNKIPPTSALDDIYENHPINKIILFGEFQVWDKEGEDISASFSPKLKELFLLLIFYSFGNGNGIATYQLTTILWPELDEKRSKNARSTSMNRLRALIANMENVTISNKNNKWIISIQSPITCDYSIYTVKKRKTKKNDESDLIALFNNGPLLKDLSYVWLDGIQAEVENYVIDLFTGIIQNASNDYSDYQLLKISENLLIWDPINPVGLKTKIDILKSQGKVGLSKKIEEKYNIY